MNYEPLDEPHVPRPAGPTLRVIPGSVPRAKTGEFRGATIGAIVGLLFVGLSVFVGALVADAGFGTALGLGIWLGFWGGGGFGFMLGAAVPSRRTK